MTRSTKVALVVVAAVLSLGFNVRMLSWAAFAATGLPVAALAASPVARALEAQAVKLPAADASCEEVVRYTVSTQGSRCLGERNRAMCLAGLEAWRAQALEDCKRFGR